MDTKDLINKRAGLVKEMRSLLDTAAKENRNLNSEEQVKYDRMESDVDSIGKDLARADNLKKLESDLANSRDSDYRASLDKRDDKSAKSKAYREAFFGQGGFLRRQGITSNLTSPILNVLQTGVDADGGYTVPEEFETEIMKLLYNADPIRAAATVMSLSSDRNIPVQTAGGTFAWLGENASYSSTQPSLGRVVLGAHKLGGYIPVSIELLQDSGSSIESFIREVGVQAIADLENAAFAAGDGSNKPQGLFDVTSVAGTSVSGVTGAVSATATITDDNLMDIFHTLPRYFRQNASWLMSDAAVKLVRKIKDGNDQYVWQPGLQAGQPDRILNRPVLVSDFATAPAASAKSIVFGDLRKYFIADRVGLTMQRLNEIAALNDQVYFKMSKRVDGRLTDARAIVTFTHGAAS